MQRTGTVPVSASQDAGPTEASAAEVPTETEASAASDAGPQPAEAPAPQAVPPAGLVTEADLSAAAAAVAGMSLADQAGTVIMAHSAHAVGTDLVSRLHLGGVILMGARGAVDGTSNGTPSQVAAVTSELQSQVPASQSDAPLLIAVDQEYGLVRRLVNGFTDFPGADELSAISSTSAAAAATEQVTAAAGAEMLAVGVNVDFAPDADVLPRSGSSAIGDRSFGSDPERVGELVAAAVRGYQSAGLAATVKHFPGIGRIATDTHVALPELAAGCPEWNSVESVPMRAGVDAGAALVMTGHVLVPAVDASGVPSSLSSAVLTQMLRGDGVAGCEGLDFHGIAVSDAFEMAPIADNYDSGEAAWRGLAAGLDLVLMPVNPQAALDGIVAAAGNGSLDPARLQEAATRVYALRLALARSPQPGLDAVGSAEHEAIAAQARSAG